MSVTVGLSPTNLKEWFLGVCLALRGTIDPRVVTKLETLSAIIDVQAETVEELEEFKRNSDKWREETINRAYDIVDRASARNTTDWISASMTRILMHEEFLSKEKHGAVDAITERGYEKVMLHPDEVIRIPNVDPNVDLQNEMRHDSAYRMSAQILADLPSLVKVTQRVEQDHGKGGTYMEMSLEPKRWAIFLPSRI